MVKDPDRLLSLAYAASSVRPRLELAYALDEALADVLKSVREPMIAQIRLAWWRDQLSALEAGNEAAPEPLLLQIGANLSSSVITALAELPSAWEHLIEDPLPYEAVARFSALRGSALASVFNSPALTKPLEFWALADFALHCSEAKLAQEVAAGAMRIAPHRLKDLPRSVRVLVGLAKDDLADPLFRRPVSPRRMIRAFRHAVLTS